MGRKQRSGRLLLLAGILAAGAALFALRLSFPAPEIYGNEKAEIDLSRLDRGMVEVRYTGGSEARIKVQITREEGEDYNYDLNNAGRWESFGLTEGDGEYTVRVLENVKESRYAPVLEHHLTLILEDPASPFRESSQYVCYSERSKAAVLAEELAAGMETEEETVDAVFEYIVGHVSYDMEKAETVKPGYLPDVDEVLAEGKGICFDYAALMTAMLRSRGIACRMAVGYAGRQYHAWVEVLSESGEWRLLDPTFVSANRGNEKVLDFVGEPENYQVRFYY